MNKHCNQCNLVIVKKPSHSLSYWKDRKFCSRSCQHKAYKGKNFSPLSQYKKGNKRSKKDEEYRLTKLRETIVGVNNPIWKGERAKYHVIHKWVTRWKGKPKLCEMCGTTAARKFEWANIDHEYRRVLEDYIRMCTKCHRNYDYSNHLSNVGSRGGSIKNKR